MQRTSIILFSVIAILIALPVIFIFSGFGLINKQIETKPAITSENNYTTYTSNGFLTNKNITTVYQYTSSGTSIGEDECIYYSGSNLKVVSMFASCNPNAIDSILKDPNWHLCAVQKDSVYLVRNNYNVVVYGSNRVGC